MRRGRSAGNDHDARTDHGDDHDDDRAAALFRYGSRMQRPLSCGPGMLGERRGLSLCAAVPRVRQQCPCLQRRVRSWVGVRGYSWRVCLRRIPSLSDNVYNDDGSFHDVYEQHHYDDTAVAVLRRDSQPG